MCEAASRGGKASSRTARDRDGATPTHDVERFARDCRAAAQAFFAGHATLSAVLPSQVSRLAGRTGGRGHGVQLVVAYLGSAAGGLVAGALAGTPAVAFAVLAGLCVAVAGLAVAALRPPPSTSASPGP